MNTIQLIGAWSAAIVLVLGTIVTGAVRIMQEHRKGRARVNDSKAIIEKLDKLCDVTEGLHTDLRTVFHIPSRERRDTTPRLGLARKKDE